MNGVRRSKRCISNGLVEGSQRQRDWGVAIYVCKPKSEGHSIFDNGNGPTIGVHRSPDVERFFKDALQRAWSFDDDLRPIEQLANGGE